MIGKFRYRYRTACIAKSHYKRLRKRQWNSSIIHQTASIILARFLLLQSITNVWHKKGKHVVQKYKLLYFYPRFNGILNQKYWIIGSTHQYLIIFLKMDMLYHEYRYITLCYWSNILFIHIHRLSWDYKFCLLVEHFRFIGSYCFKKQYSLILIKAFFHIMQCI